MLTFVNPKINLGLNIVRRRDDGYHDLETIFYPVGKYSGSPEKQSRLTDVIELIPAKKDRLEQCGIRADCTIENNLVMKALRLFRDEAEKRGIAVPPYKIDLVKHIPYGAGLGGGSADATFTLLALNELHDNPFNTDELIEISRRIGADCPFFVINEPCYAEGVGEQLKPIELNLSGYWLGVAKPVEGISTKEAFERANPHAPAINLKEIAKMPIEKWRDLMVNDFEESIFSWHPQLRQVKQALYDNGAIYAAMTGSGSAFYGIFRSEEEAEKAIDATRCPERFTVAL